MVNNGPFTWYGTIRLYGAEKFLLSSNGIAVATQGITHVTGGAGVNTSALPV